MVINITDVNDDLSSLRGKSTSDFFWDGYDIVKWTPSITGPFSQNGMFRNDKWGIKEVISYSHVYKGWPLQF